MATTTTYSLEKPTVGGSENTWGGDWNDNADKIDDLLDGTLAIKPNLDEGLWEVGGVAVTATAAELNILDGVTASTAQLNLLDGTAGSLSNRNKVINGNFDIWQRGTSGTSGYVADRWRTLATGSTASISRQAFTLGQTDVPNEPEYFHRVAVTSSAGSGNLVVMQQRVEFVRTFAGQTVTLSFWAKADAGKDIAVEFSQDFGVGGSSAVTAIGVTTCTLTTSWQKFTVTASISSISGKTIGSQSSIDLTFWFDAGSNFNSRTNTLGQQSGTFDIAQVQLEAGSVATPFEVRSIGQELTLCQRYYEVLQGSITGGFDANVNIHNSIWPFKVRKRVAPTMTWVASAVAGRGVSQDFATVLNDANDRSKIGDGTSADAEL